MSYDSCWSLSFWIVVVVLVGVLLFVVVVVSAAGRMKWWQVCFDWEAERGTLSQEKRPTDTNVSGKSQQLSQIYVGFTYD